MGGAWHRCVKGWPATACRTHVSAGDPRGHCGGRRIALKMGDATSAIFPARFRSTTPGACSDPEGRSPRLDSASASTRPGPAGPDDCFRRHLQHGLEQSDLGGGARVHQGWRKTFRRSAARRRDPQPGARASLVSPAFGRPCPAYGSSAPALEYFALRTHAVGIRLTEADGSSASMTSFRFASNRTASSTNRLRTRKRRAGEQLA
jgi:hypothetical protein